MSAIGPIPEQLVLTQFTLNPGQTIKISGFIPENAKYLAFNLGKDEKNFALHFNLRFDFGGITRTIVFNSLKDNNWENEHRETYFPFQCNTHVEISITFDGHVFILNLPEKRVFPNRHEGDAITYFSVVGDFNPKEVSFH